ncbi:MAG: nuclear transport factor 2 family protein [Pyrinomonadaceae bacterium]
MSEQENTALVQQAYDNFKNRDIDGLLSLFSEEITWELPEMDGVSYGGKRAGLEEVVEFFAMLGMSQEPLRFEPREFIAQDDRVVCLGSYDWRVRETNREFSSDFAHVFTIADGKIVAFSEFMDTAAVVAAHQKAMSA